MKYFFITGENSGDSIAATVVNDIYEKEKSAEIYYWGGPALAQTDATALADIEQFKIMGFSEVIMKMATLLNLFRKCKRDIEHIHPDVLILVDFGGFNLRIAQWAKKKGYKIVYLSPPKTWASRPKRNEILKKYVDLLIVLFPFEKEYFERNGISALCFGHPITQKLVDTKSSAQLKSLYNLDTRPIVCIAPGSRRQEINHVLPPLIDLSVSYPMYHWCVSCASGIDRAYLQKLISKTPAAQCHIVTEPLSLLLSISDYAFITSGTATLEAALFNVPQVVCYKTSWVNYQIAKRLITIPYISLVNLIMNRKVVAELIQSDFTIGNLSKAMNDLLQPDLKANIQEDYQRLAAKMTTKESFSAVATTIIDLAE
jgi:lipid-A-disaccharide synthase